MCALIPLHTAWDYHPVSLRYVYRRVRVGAHLFASRCVYYPAPRETLLVSRSFVSLRAQNHTRNKYVLFLTNQLEKREASKCALRIVLVASIP